MEEEKEKLRRMMLAASHAIDLPEQRRCGAKSIVWWVIAIAMVTILLASLAYPAEHTLFVGAGIGQNNVTTKSVRYEESWTIDCWNVGPVAELSFHRNDGKADIASLELQLRRLFNSLYTCVFAGIGHAFHVGGTEDLAGRTIGKWGAGVGVRTKRFDVQLRVTHSSNPFENHEYGHNVLSAIAGWRW